jgi:hypothetical protein
MYIFIASTAYTADIYFKINSVMWLTVCRILLLFAGATFLVMDHKAMIREIDALAIVLMAIIFVGAAGGLFGLASWTTYFRHGFQYIFMLEFYLIGRGIARSGDIKPWQMNAACIAALSGYTISSALYALTPGLRSGAYSFQPNLALLPLAHNSSVLMSGAAAVVIVIGNKRAVLVGACFCVAALAVPYFARCMNGLRTAVRSALILLLTPAILIVTTWALSLSNIPLMAMVANRLSLAPSFINTDTKTLLSTTASAADKIAPTSIVGDRIQGPAIHQAQSDAAVANENAVDPTTRFTGARNVEIEAVWNLIKSNALTGVGFGSNYEMKYISPNDYEPVSFPRDQADVMPAHIAMTSGLPLSILFSVVLFIAFWQIFLSIGELHGMDRTLSLFVLSLSLDIVLGFTGTNPIIWSAVGYATASLSRTRSST